MINGVGAVNRCFASTGTQVAGWAEDEGLPQPPHLHPRAAPGDVKQQNSAETLQQTGRRRGHVKGSTSTVLTEWPSREEWRTTPAKACAPPRPLGRLQTERRPNDDPATGAAMLRFTAKRRGFDASRASFWPLSVYEETLTQPLGSRG
jgi:hypothetical protein